MKRALVLDESPVLAEQLGHLLRQAGMCCEQCREAPDAHALAGASVVFVELLRWRANGFSLLRRLAAGTDTPLVLVSGTRRKSDRAWALQAGASALLERPLSPRRVHACLAGLGLGVAEAAAQA